MHTHAIPHYFAVLAFVGRNAYEMYSVYSSLIAVYCSGVNRVHYSPRSLTKLRVHHDENCENRMYTTHSTCTNCTIIQCALCGEMFHQLYYVHSPRFFYVLITCTRAYKSFRKWNSPRCTKVSPEQCSGKRTRNVYCRMLHGISHAALLQ